jgi:hypothetical protein
MKMKKMILVALTVFGVTNFASAWEVWKPQEITAEGNRTTFTCENWFTNSKCMSGEGDSPKVGQSCTIYHHGHEILGVVVRSTFIEDFPSDNPSNNPSDIPLGVEVVAQSEYSIGD